MDAVVAYLRSKHYGNENSIEKLQRYMEEEKYDTEAFRQDLDDIISDDDNANIKGSNIFTITDKQSITGCLHYVQNHKCMFVCMLMTLIRSHTKATHVIWCALCFAHTQYSVVHLELVIYLDIGNVGKTIS